MGKRPISQKLSHASYDYRSLNKTINRFYGSYKEVEAFVDSLSKAKNKKNKNK